MKNMETVHIRSIWMYLIVISYVIKISDASSQSIQFAEVLNIMGVNGFTITLGYALREEEFHISDILSFCLQIFMYSIGIAVLLFLLPIGDIGIQDLLRCLQPISKSNYWYCTAYVCLFFFQPFLRLLLSCLSTPEKKILFVVLSVILSVMPTIMKFDLSNVNYGYSCLWITYVFLLGACIKRKDTKHNGRIGLINLLLGILFFAVSYILCTRVDQIYLQMNAPLFVLSVIGIFRGFLYFKKQTTKESCLGFIGTRCFSVYLIIAHPYLWSQLKQLPFEFLFQIIFPQRIIVIVLITYLLVLTSAAIEEIRLRFVHKIRMDVVIDGIGRWLDRAFYANMNFNLEK